MREYNPNDEEALSSEAATFYWDVLGGLNLPSHLVSEGFREDSLSLRNDLKHAHEYRAPDGGGASEAELFMRDVM